MLFRSSLKAFPAMSKGRSYGTIALTNPSDCGWELPPPPRIKRLHAPLPPRIPPPPLHSLPPRPLRRPDYLHYTSSRQFTISLISGHGTLDVLVIPRWAQDPEFRRGRYDPHVYY